jgi:hypothetical protein
MAKIVYRCSEYQPQIGAEGGWNNEESIQLSKF